MPFTPKENPEIDPLPHTEPVVPSVPEIIPGPEKTEPMPPLPETAPIRFPEITPAKDL